MIANIANLFAGKPSVARARLRQAQADLAAKRQHVADLETAVAPLRKIREAADEAETAQSRAERMLTDKREELQRQHKYGDRHLADLIEAKRAAAKAVEDTELEAFRTSEDLAKTEHELREAHHAARGAERAVESAAQDVVVDEGIRVLAERARTSAARFIADRDVLRAAYSGLGQHAPKEEMLIPEYPVEVSKYTTPAAEYQDHLARRERSASQLAEVSRRWSGWFERLKLDSEAPPPAIDSPI